MTPAERQNVIDLADLAVNRYFDHYLTDVFPEQMGRMFTSHNKDVDAHPVQFKIVGLTKARVDRWKWMIAGAAIVVSTAVSVGPLVFRWLGH